jgi:hypothetical protein
MEWLAHLATRKEGWRLMSEKRPAPFEVSLWVDAASPAGRGVYKINCIEATGWVFFFCYLPKCA